MELSSENDPRNAIVGITTAKVNVTSVAVAPILNIMHPEQSFFLPREAPYSKWQFLNSIGTRAQKLRSQKSESQTKIPNSTFNFYARIGRRRKDAFNITNQLPLSIWVPLSTQQSQFTQKLPNVNSEEKTRKTKILKFQSQTELFKISNFHQAQNVWENFGSFSFSQENDRPKIRKNKKFRKFRIGFEIWDFALKFGKFCWKFLGYFFLKFFGNFPVSVFNIRKWDVERESWGRRWRSKGTTHVTELFQFQMMYLHRLFWNSHPKSWSKEISFGGLYLGSTLHPLIFQSR
jgi:hypothetical protein